MFLPVALGTVVGAHTGSQLIGRIGPRPVASAGLVIAAIGTAIPAIWDGTAALVIGLSVGAVGIGATFVASSTTALSQVGHHEAGLASGILSTFHEFGAAIGVAAVSSIAAASIAGTSGAGFEHGFTFAAITAVVAGALALLVVPAGKPAHAISAH
jgi:MFS family permease